MNNYCPDLFNTIFIQKVNESESEIGHCCVSKLSDPVSTIDFQSDFLATNRQHFLSTGNLPPACVYCTTAESKGQISRRTKRSRPYVENNKYPTEVVLEHLDYNCDNICNLKCIMCSGYYSSAWREDEVALGFRIDYRTKPTKHNTMIYDADVSKLKSIYFNGGEPLMTRDHINVLNHALSNSQEPQHIRISYSSNGTFPMTDEMADLWKQFEAVYINFSIDATEKEFEYIRFPAIWADVEKNIDTFRLPNLVTKITATVGVHNILYFDKLYHWAAKRNIEIYVQDTNGRSQLAIQNFPRAGKDRLIAYLNKLPESGSKQSLLNLAHNINNDGHARWIEYLNKLDRMRGNNWRNSLSRLNEIMDVWSKG